MIAGGSTQDGAGTPRSFSRVLGHVVRLACAVGLTAWLLWKSHPRDVLAVTAHADWWPIVVAVLLVLADRALMAYRWIALLCTVERSHRPRFGALMRLFFESTFLGTFLPASVGADALRSYGAVKLNVPSGDAVASVLMDRMLGVASVLLMALVGLGLARNLASNSIVLTALALTTAICLVTMLLIFDRRSATLVATWVGRIPMAGLQHFAVRVLESLRKYAGHSRQLALVLLCSVGVQVLRTVQAYYLGVSLGIQAPLAAYFAFIPLTLLVMLLPITINGLGTGQVAFVVLFAQAGVGNAEAFALSVLFVALGLVGNLPGAFLYVFRGSRSSQI